MKLPFVNMWAEGLARIREHVRATGAGKYALWVALAALLAHIGMGAAGPVWGYDALNYDDPQVLAVVEDSSVVEILTQPTYFAYKPVYFLSLQVDHLLGGLFGDGGVVAFAHTVNWLLHALAAWLLVVLLAHAFRRPFIALAAGLLFAVHPVHVESVAWISERKDLLSLLFVLWAHLSYRLRRERGATRFLVPAVWLLLGGLAKGTVWSYAGVIACDELMWQLRGDGLSRRLLLRRLAPVAIVAVLGVALDFWIGVNHGPGAVEHAATGGELVGAMAGVHAAYVQHVLVPVDLALDYAVDPAGSLANPAAVIGLLLALGWLALLVVSMKRRFALGVFAAAFWIFGLAPVNNLLPRTTTLIADRYLYMPAIGMYVLLAYGISRVRFQRTYVLGAVGLVLGVLCVMRTAAFASSEAVWTRTIEAVPESALAHIQRGQDRARRMRYAEALGDADAAVALRPRAELLVRARLVRCASLLGLGEAKKLRYEAQAVVELIGSLPATALVERERPGVLAEAETFLGNAFQAVGYQVAALEAFERAVLHDRTSGVAQYNFATALAGLKDRRSLLEAKDRLEIAVPLVRRDPRMHKQALIQLAAVQGRLGALKVALETLAEAAQIYRNDPDVYYAEARIRLGTGAINRAKELLNTIRHFAPDHAKGARLSAEILVAEGKLLLRKYKDDRKQEWLKRAVHKFDEAVKSDTTYWQAHVAAGDSFMERGLFPEARGRYRRALKTNSNLGWVRALIARTHVIECAWMDKFASRAVDAEAQPAVQMRAARIMAAGLAVRARRVDFGFTALGAEQALLREVAEVLEKAEGVTAVFASAVLRAAAHLCAGGDLDMAQALLTQAASGLTDEPGHAKIRDGVLLLRALVNHLNADVAGARRDYASLAQRRPTDPLPRLRLRELDLLVAGARLKTAMGYREDKAGLKRAKTQQRTALAEMVTFANDHPDSVAAGLAAASAEMSQDRWTDATRRLNRLVERFPENPDVYRGRSTVYLSRRVQTTDTIWIRELTGQADRELQKAITLDPRNVRAHLDASSLARSAQDLTMAIKHARRARDLEAVPGGPAARTLGILLTAVARKAIGARQIERATALIAEARKINPHGAMPWVLEAELVLATPARTMLVDAEERARKAMELEPLSIEARVVMAKIRKRQGVVADTRRATLREPANPVTEAGEAWAGLDVAERERRIKAYDRARTTVRHQREQLYRTAVMNLESALMLDPRSQDVEEIEGRLERLRRRDPTRRGRDERRAMTVLYPEARQKLRTQPAEAYDLLLEAVAIYPRFVRGHLKIAEVVTVHLLPRYRFDDPKERRLIESYISGAFMSIHMLDQLDGADLYPERIFFRAKLNLYLFRKRADAEAKTAAVELFARYVALMDAWVAEETAKPESDQNGPLLQARRHFRDHARVTLTGLRRAARGPRPGSDEDK